MAINLNDMPKLGFGLMRLPSASTNNTAHERSCGNTGLTTQMK